MQLSSYIYIAVFIRSITPQSGPTVGGTVVTITGSDLGVDHTDIDIKIGGVNCSVKHFSYLTGEYFLFIRYQYFKSQEVTC